MPFLSPSSRKKKCNWKNLVKGGSCDFVHLVNASMTNQRVIIFFTQVLDWDFFVDAETAASHSGVWQYENQVHDQQPEAYSIFATITKRNLSKRWKEGLKFWIAMLTTQQRSPHRQHRVALWRAYYSSNDNVMQYDVRIVSVLDWALVMIFWRITTSMSLHSEPASLLSVKDIQAPKCCLGTEKRRICLNPSVGLLSSIGSLSKKQQRREEET